MMIGMYESVSAINFDRDGKFVDEMNGTSDMTVGSEEELDEVMKYAVKNGDGWICLICGDQSKFKYSRLNTIKRHLGFVHFNMNACECW